MAQEVFIGFWWESGLSIGVRGGGSGKAAAPPVFKNFRANSVCRACASC